MRQILYVYVHRAESGFLAECYDLPLSTQSESLDEAISEIQSSIDTYLANNDPLQFGLAPNPDVVVTFQLGPSPED